MLSSAEQQILENNIQIILGSPASLNRAHFIETYNLVYRYCTVPAETYYIEGEAIYNLIDQIVTEYSQNILFTASIPLISAQFQLFRDSCSLLAREYQFIERFYINTNYTTKDHIQKIEHLFYNRIYYNYIYKIEESLINLIFHDIEISRQNYKQDCKDLRNIATLYIDLLIATGQEEKLKKFIRMYMNNFLKATDFSTDIGRLLKKVYLELYYVMTILNERLLCKEIVERVSFRIEEIMDFAISKMCAFESIKHIFKIVSMMNEQSRKRFNEAYKTFAGRYLSTADSFQSHYQAYNRLYVQLVTNKMEDYLENLEAVAIQEFKNRSAEQQELISRGMLEMINNINEESNCENMAVFRTLLYEKETKAVQVAAETAYPYKDLVKNLSDKEEATEFKDSECCNSCHIESYRRSYKAVSNSQYNSSFNYYNGNTNKLETVKLAPLNAFNQKPESIYSYRIDRLVDLFCMLINERSAKLYIRKCQERLLKGCDAENERRLLMYILEKAGMSDLVKLYSIIDTYLYYNVSIFGANSNHVTTGNNEIIENNKVIEYESTVKVRLLKHAMGFWNKYLVENEKDKEYREAELTAFLENIKNCAIKSEALRNREKFDINLRLSPIYFEFKKCQYKMDTVQYLDFVYIRDYVASSDGSLNGLSERMESPSFRGHFECFVENELIEEQDGCIRFSTKKNKRKYVNLFEIEKRDERGESTAKCSSSNVPAAEAAICRILKRTKSKCFEDLKGSLAELGLSDEAEKAVENLKEKGYIEESEKILHYIP
ncbi:hypothetical protein ENBRE01_1412 [Enteropsectra breve]|nr:hypothetical protein ENBRE01_1412 [Enteropsectra breve]